MVGPDRSLKSKDNSKGSMGMGRMHFPYALRWASLVQHSARLSSASLVSRFELFQLNKYLLGISHAEGICAQKWMLKKKRIVGNITGLHTPDNTPTLLRDQQNFKINKH